MIDLHSNRKNVFIIIFLGIAILYSIKIFSLQVVGSKYEARAINNALNKITIYPARSNIYDRNGKLMVYNIAIYDLIVFPGQIKKIDTADFCEQLGIDKKEFAKRMSEAKKNAAKRQKNNAFSKSAVFMPNLTPRQQAVMQENLYRFDGFYIEPKTDRLYAVKGGAHMLGYLGEISEKMLKDSGYYQPGDLVGTTGLEKSYEGYMRGTKGVKTVWQDRTYTQRGVVKNDEFNYDALSGPDFHTSIDFDLQEFGESLLDNKRGSLIAIEPSTGEILALVNKPDYDPNILVGETRDRSYRGLVMNASKPLYNRAIKGAYPPGSTYKTVMAAIAQQEQAVTPETKYACHMGYNIGSLHIGCHAHPSPLDLRGSIGISCNAYYCQLFRAVVDNPKYPDIRAGYAALEKHLRSFGLGSPLGVDLPGELGGNVPSIAQLDKRHGPKWKSSTIISLSIGQGEILLTPLQMANVAAIMANRGFFFTPHLIRGIGPSRDIPKKFKHKHYTSVAPVFFDPVVDGMELVTKPGGTAWGTAPKDIVICAKTGTAQNPHGQDHSLYIAFAPRINPRIAIAVVVENGGYGATWAAPIANLCIERYLTPKGTPSTIQYLLEAMQKGVVNQ